MKRPYEMMIVFDGTLPEEVLRKEQTQVEEYFKQNALFERTEVWGKRGLAYPIRKKRIGYYCLFIYEGEGQVAAGIERQLKLNERVLRYLIVVRDLNNEAARAEFFARREKASEEVAAPKVVEEVSIKE